MNKEDTIVSLDIGSSKVAVAVGIPEIDGSLKLLGIGQAPAEGIKRGMIVDLEKVVGSIHNAVADAELVSGYKISSVYTSINGEHIKSINSRGAIAIGKGTSEITPTDVQRVIEMAQAVAIPTDREIIHILPQEFTVDDQSGITDPVGMMGIRLEVNIHIVTGSAASVTNIIKAIEKANLDVEELVLSPYAAAYAVLKPDERELGCALIDLGANTTDIAAFLDGSIKHTAVIGVGGKNVTNDIAIGLRTPLEQAERIKCLHGSALSTLVSSSDMIIVPGVAGRESKQISRSVAAAIIEPRSEEIFSLVARDLKRANLIESLASGIILTGGASQLQGVAELAEQIFNLPAKLAVPECIFDENIKAPGPEHAAVIGLLRYGLVSDKAIKGKTGRKRGPGFIERIKTIFSEYF